MVSAWIRARRPRARAAALLVTAALSLAGVAGACRGATSAGWKLVFGEGVDAAAVARVTLRVRRDACRSGAVVFEADVSRGDAVPDLGELSAGPHAFEGEARDATCRVIARGCRLVELPLPTGTELVTTLEPQAVPIAACAPESCVAGRCAPGSLYDAGPDDDAGVAP